jgi:hypothetical protein
MRKPISAGVYIPLGLLVTGLILTGAVELQRVVGAGEVSLRPISIPSGVILRGEDFGMLVDEVRGVEFVDVTIVEPTAVPMVSRYGAAYWDRSRQELILAGRSDLPVENVAVMARPRVPGAVASAARDADAAAQLIAGAPGRTLPAVLGIELNAFLMRLVSLVFTVGAFSVAVAGMWTPARASRWPLLNAVLALAYGRVVLAASRVRALPNAIPISPAPEIVDVMLPEALWLGVGLASLTISALLPPLKTWRRGVLGDGAPS